MSKYVTHKHGMTIGSDNVFFIHDGPNELGKPGPPEGVERFRDGYRAIVSFDGIHFDKINTINVSVRTPAHQIVWKQKTVEVDRSYTDKNGIFREWRYEDTFWVLQSWSVNWLNKNIGDRYDMWDTYTYNRSFDECLFFKKRKDALAFVKFIQQQLVGMRIGLHS